MLKYTTRKFAALAMVGSGLLTSCNALDATTAVVGRKSNAGVNGGERVILQCRTDCSELATAITAQGGRVVYRFQNVAALTAEIPPGASGKILSLPAVKASAKDYLLTVPPAQRDARRESGATVERKRSANLIVRATANNYNTLGTGIEQLHTQGYTGKDVIVAVIDSGIANNPKKVPALAGSVIGGENFVSLPSEPSATSTLNDPHGTEVSSLIAGHAIVSLPGDDPLSLAMAAHAPESVSLSDSAIDIPVIGMAPEAKLYAIKVFPANGDGTPSSIVLMGMDRALTLKRNFNTGGSKRPVSGRGTEDSPYVYDALNIQVVNLSLGGDALFPGFEVDDLLVTEMLNNGIVVAVSAGNEGPANLTIGSPAAGFGALSVGAVNLAIHDRVRGELRLGPGQGSLFRPTTYTQLASFSSRGPLPDGRDGVHLVSNGVGLVMQGASGAMALASGTSYSAPLVAGAAATLIAAVPTANSQQVRSALVEGADPGVLGQHTKRADQGHGVLNVAASLALLVGGNLDVEPLRTTPPDTPIALTTSLAEVGYAPVELDAQGQFSADIAVIAGQVAQFLIPIPANAADFTVDVAEVSPLLPTDQQNSLNGDRLLVSVMDSGRYVDALLFEDFVSDKFEQTFPLPQTGLARVAILGARDNAGMVNAKLHIAVTQRSLVRPLASGAMLDEDSRNVAFEVRPNTRRLVLELAWNTNWAFYPTHDLDVLLFDPTGNEILDDVGFPPGATLRSPERVVVDDPSPGVWKARIEGYMLHGFEDRYSLRATDQDNKPLRRASRN